MRRWRELLGRPVDLIIDPRRPQGHSGGWRPSVSACAQGELSGALAIIATPITALFATTTALIEAGVSGALLEKPGAASSAELKVIEGLARHTQVKVAVGYIERFNRQTQPLLRALEDWWRLPDEGRPPLKVSRSGRGEGAPLVPQSLDLWCHDLNLLQLAARRAGRGQACVQLKVTAQGALMLNERRVGLISSALNGERRWLIGSTPYCLKVSDEAALAPLDPLSEECLAFARWVQEGVWSTALCTLDEAIETLSALPTHDLRP